MTAQPGDSILARHAYDTPGPTVVTEHNQIVLFDTGAGTLEEQADIIWKVVSHTVKRVLDVPDPLFPLMSGEYARFWPWFPSMQPPGRRPNPIRDEGNYEKLIIGTMPFAASMYPVNPPPDRCCGCFPGCNDADVQFDVTDGPLGKKIGVGHVSGTDVRLHLTTPLGHEQVLQGELKTHTPCCIGEGHYGVTWNTGDVARHYHLSGHVYDFLNCTAGSRCGACMACMLACSEQMDCRTMLCCLLVCACSANFVKSCCGPKHHRVGLYGLDGYNEANNQLTEIRFYNGHVEWEPPITIFAGCCANCCKCGEMCKCCSKQYRTGGHYSYNPIRHETLENLVYRSHGTVFRTASKSQQLADISGTMDTRVRILEETSCCGMCKKDDLVDGKAIQPNAPPIERSAIDVAFSGTLTPEATLEDQRIMLGFGVLSTAHGVRHYARYGTLDGFAPFIANLHHGLQHVRFPPVGTDGQAQQMAMANSNGTFPQGVYGAPQPEPAKAMA